jgi:pyruvate dehydrogenase E2 component (dihydrolipoamide acetyltransferase)
MSEFRMPSLGADMEAGVLVEWKIKPGDHVKRGDIVAVVETVKAAIDVEIFATGVVHKLLVPPGEKVPVGTPLAIILDAEGQPPTPAPTRERIRVSPLARKKAEELGVDLGQIHGTAPDGAITVADVERAAGAAQISLPPEKKAESSPAFGIRRAIAAAMARSNREIPHYYLETPIDMQSAMQWLQAENLKRPVKERLLPAALLIRSVVLALTEAPDLNGHWIDDRHVIQEAVHVGFAIALRQGGLITPALVNAHQKNLSQIMASLSDLIVRARSGHLRSSEMSDATITITNLGDLGVETVFGVIYPPQVALVGFGQIQDRPWAANGMLGVRPVLTATLAGDHRATDGRLGAQFLEALNRRLQHPDKL